MRYLWWSALTVAAFLLGFAAGRSGGPLPEVLRPPPAAPASQSRAEATVSDAAAVADAWTADLAAVDELACGGRRAEATALAARLLDDVARQARTGDVTGARQRLAQYLRHDPYDPEAYFLESDLWQMQGQGEQALEPLFVLLGFADSAAVIERARHKLDLLVGVLESQRATRDDVPGLIRLFEELSARDPQFDGHRLELARWLLRAGRLDEAGAVLAETGTAGIDPAARDDLLTALTLAREGLPLERDATAGRPSALHVRASAAGRRLRLLVDTGATTTAISRARADALDAVPTGERVRVRTASGVVDAEIRRLSDVQVGALHLPTLDVIVLERPLPDAVDGLLGMDVLSHFPGITVGTMPRDL